LGLDDFLRFDGSFWLLALSLFLFAVAAVAKVVEVPFVRPAQGQVRVFAVARISCFRVFVGVAVNWRDLERVLVGIHLSRLLFIRVFLLGLRCRLLRFRRLAKVRAFVWLDVLGGGGFLFSPIDVIIHPVLLVRRLELATGLTHELPLISATLAIFYSQSLVILLGKVLLLLRVQTLFFLVHDQQLI